jgi:hypothetical protein
MRESFTETVDRYMIAAQEDRCAPRTRLTIPATLRASGTRGFQTVVSDLSISGFCASSVNRVHPGTVCWLTLPGLESLQAEVIWWDNSLIGCAFDSLLSPIIHDNLLARFAPTSVYRTLS